MSLFALGGNVGLAVGPALMGIGLILGPRLGPLLFAPAAFVTGALVTRSLRAMYSGGWRHPAKVQGEAAPQSALRLNHRQRRRAVALLLMVIFLRSGAHTSLITFVPLYFTNLLGNSTAYSSLGLTVFLIAGAAGTAIGGVVADRRGPQWVIVASLLLSAPLIALIPLAGSGFFPILLLGAVGLTLVSSFAVTTVMGQELMPESVGLASGLTLGFSVGTGGLTVTFLGWIGDQWGLTVVFAAIAVLAVLGGMLSWSLPSHRRQAAMPAGESL